MNLYITPRSLLKYAWAVEVENILRNSTRRPSASPNPHPESNLKKKGRRNYISKEGEIRAFPFRAQGRRGRG